MSTRFARGFCLQLRPIFKASKVQRAARKPSRRLPTWARPPRTNQKPRPRGDDASQLPARSPMHDSATAFRAFVKVAISGMPLVSQARTPAVQAGHVGIQFVVFHLGHPKRLRTARTGAGKGGD